MLEQPDWYFSSCDAYVGNCLGMLESEREREREREGGTEGQTQSPKP